jgi:hypothetical protein
MIFSRPKSPPSLPSPLLMGGVKVEVVGEFKYLGVTLDSLIDWKIHIETKITNTKKNLMMLQQGLGTTWGPSPAITL